MTLVNMEAFMGSQRWSQNRVNSVAYFSAASINRSINTAASVKVICSADAWLLT